MTTFQELELIHPLQRALADEKYETPTPIQAQTIPSALLGKDLLGSAQTGTGKTAAFTLPILNKLGKQNRKAISNHPFALILAPTRELAIQIGDSIATYGRHLRLRHVLVYGGVGQRNQVRSLRRGSHILVATPGRLLDLMNQGHIELDRMEFFVLDEADRMLDMGFLPDLKRIISKLPEKRQSMFFSATLPPKIIELSKNLLTDPITVDVTPESSDALKIEQVMMFLERSEKQAVLKKILRSKETGQALVFTKTKRTADMLTEQLQKGDILATAIHGNKSQNARQKALLAFRNNRVQVLVATDVAARGIDIDGLSHVINYDLPLEAEAYIHRIGRTGRAGAEGVAISFCSSAELRELWAIERLIGQKVPVDPEHPAKERKARSGPSPRGKRNSSKRYPASGGGGGGGGGSRPKRPKYRSTESSTESSSRSKPKKRKPKQKPKPMGQKQRQKIKPPQS